jgi:tetratricopeptide (TPR) repeat protein
VKSEANEEQLRIKKQIEYFMNIGRYEKVKVLATDLITRYPNDPYGYYAMSIYEYNLRRIDNAIELCHKSMEYGINQLTSGLLLMVYYNEKRDYSNVDVHYNSLKQKYPFSNDALAVYGYSLWQRGQKDEGISILRKALSYDSSDPMIIEFLFNATKTKKDLDHLNMLLKLYMNSGASEKQKQVLAGEYEFYSSNWSEAKKCFQRALELNPTDAKSLHYIKIIEQRKILPLLVILVVCIPIYFFRFDFQRVPYGFIPPILVLLMLLVVILVKKKSERLFQSMHKKLHSLCSHMAFATAIFLVIMGCLLKYSEIDFKNNVIKTSAEIIGVTEYGYPVLAYVVDGKQYKLRSGKHISNNNIGTNVEIEYHKRNPANSYIGDNPVDQSSLLMIGMGGFCAIGLGVMLHKERKR